MPHPEWGAFKDGALFLSPEHRCGLDAAGQLGRVHPTSDHVAWRRLSWGSGVERLPRCYMVTLAVLPTPHFRCKSYLWCEAVSPEMGSHGCCRREGKASEVS